MFCLRNKTKWKLIFEKIVLYLQEMRSSLNSKNTEMSELKIRIDDLKNVINREEKTKDELQANYQRRLREKQAEVDAYKRLVKSWIHLKYVDYGNIH